MNRQQDLAVNVYKHYQITLHEKVLEIYLSDAAHQMLSLRQSPLYVELELYFGCLTRKRVRFHVDNDSDYCHVSDKLQLLFRPVMTQRCSMYDRDRTPPVTDFPIERAGRFIPRWVNIDYRNGCWQGEFGYLMNH
jgi:hypothetical protein